MNAQVLVFYGIFLTIYVLANFYVGLRGWQAFRSLPAFPGGRFYCGMFSLAAGCYVLERLFGGILPAVLGTGLSIAGGLWMALLYYLFLGCATVDLIRAADRIIPVLPARWKQGPAAGAVVAVLAFAVVGYGTWNAYHPVWRQYDIFIDKPAVDLQELNVVLVTDIHLGKVVRNSRLESLVESVNARRPDLILLAGDIIDEDIGQFVDQHMADTLRGLHSRYGVFAVPGNHEYIGRHPDAALDLLRSGGITVLRDSVFTVGDKLILAGRDDWDRRRFTGVPRKALREFLPEPDATRPLLLLDHQPRDLAEASSGGVDLMLSGHTHRGQLFPNQWITARLYETDWGHSRKGAMHVIVSAGYGTWGPPVRTSADAEIVDIRISFRNRPE